ncbi:fasciclin domain-containing protein [Flavicella sediminum]|uniref:fasciclin domain-containing protein n=1 Tax=Flavicella sediminum TaxID=2585141 RepID=UPI00111EF085|nr:fasciclin domain-containing protein [Flavicella sediminum]
MKQKIKHLVALITTGLFIIVFALSCRPDSAEFDRPADLAGTVYLQLESMGTFNYYLKCLDQTEYKEGLLKGGSWTVFVPSDNAFEAFMAEEGYTTFEEIPSYRIKRLVEHSLVTDAYNTTTLTYYRNGWYEGNAFRRDTHFQDSIVEVDAEDYPNFDDWEPGKYKVDQSSGRIKTTNFFIQSYFDFDRHPTEIGDYDFMFPGESYTAGDMKVADAHVSQTNVVAENGIIYVLDKVVEPRPNLYQNLTSPEYEGKYTLFKSLLERFAYFNDRGEQINRYTGETERLYYITFQTGIAVNKLAFNPNDESYPPLVNNVNRTWANATGMLVPTNDALMTYLEGNSVLGNYYSSYDDMPLDVLGKFLNTFLFQDWWNICPSHSGKTFNIAIDQVDYKLEDAVDRKFCSNGFFVGIDDVYTNSSFSTIMGPLLLDDEYTIMLKTVKDLGIDNALQSKGIDFSILGVKNHQFINIADPNSATRKVSVVDYNEDLSVIYMEVTGDPVAANNRVYPELNDPSPSSADISYVTNTLKSIVLNQIIEEEIDPTANNYYETKSGEFVYAHAGNRVSGGGDLALNNTIEIVKANNTDNGVFYEMSGPVERPLVFTYGALAENSASFSSFIDVLKGAGTLVAIPNYGDDFLLSFINLQKKFTLLAPNNDAVAQAVIDEVIPDPDPASLAALSDLDRAIAKRDLLNFAKKHFLQEAIPTDGKTAGTFASLYFAKEIDFVPVYDEFTIENDHANLSLTIKNATTGELITQTAGLTNVLSKKVVIHEIDNYLK